MFVAELTLVYGRYNELDNYTGWWYTYPSEKYETQLGLLFPIYGKIKKCSKPPPDINIAIPKQIKKKSKTCKT